jgi:hypothetical protein
LPPIIKIVICNYFKEWEKYMWYDINYLQPRGKQYLYFTCLLKIYFSTERQLTLI